LGEAELRRPLDTPRTWSNKELRKVAGLLPRPRRVINVSGWKDADKEGSTYRAYFNPSEAYDISNYEADAARGGPGSVALDLGEPAPPHLVGRYDVAFSHTVLEHVPDPWFAFAQIAKLTSDLIVTVVPFKQKLHFEAGMYGDYYRFTPFAMRRMHEANGFTLLYESFTPRPSLDVYLLHVGTKAPDRHGDFPRSVPDLAALNEKVGEFSAKDLLENVVDRFLAKYVRREKDWRDL
jgi:hypothetical protein